MRLRGEQPESDKRHRKTLQYKGLGAKNAATKFSLKIDLTILGLSNEKNSQRPQAPAATKSPKTCKMMADFVTVEV